MYPLNGLFCHHSSTFRELLFSEAPIGKGAPLRAAKPRLDTPNPPDRENVFLRLRGGGY